MHIRGNCHCGNIGYELERPGDASDIRLHACDCTFCSKHGGNWTSNRDAQLVARIADASLHSKYRFGTSTGDFHVCARCGVVPFVTSTIDGRIYAVVNVNTVESIDVSSLARTPAHFDGEATGERLERRARNWISKVTIHGG